MMEKAKDRITTVLKDAKKIKKVTWKAVLRRLTGVNSNKSTTNMVVKTAQSDQSKVDVSSNNDAVSQPTIKEESQAKSSEIQPISMDFSINIVVIKTRLTPVIFSVVSIFNLDRKIIIQEERIDPDDVATSPLHDHVDGKNELFSWMTPSDQFAKDLFPTRIDCEVDVVNEVVVEKGAPSVGELHAAHISSTDDDNDISLSNRGIKKTDSPSSSDHDAIGSNKADINIAIVEEVNKIQRDDRKFFKRLLFGHSGGKSDKSIQKECAEQIIASTKVKLYQSEGIDKKCDAVAIHEHVDSCASNDSTSHPVLIKELITSESTKSTGSAVDVDADT